MARRTQMVFLAAGAAALALGASGWALAQQGVTPTTPQAPPAAVPTIAPPPPAADQEQAPPTVSQLSGVAPALPSSEAADVEPAEAGSSAAATAAAAKPAAPMTRPRYAVAVLQALDKVTAETIRFEAPVGKPIRYKSLVFIVHACETNAADEAVPEAAAHLEVDSAPIAQQGGAALSSEGCSAAGCSPMRRA